MAPRFLKKTFPSSRRAERLRKELHLKGAEKELTVENILK